MKFLKKRKLRKGTEHLSEAGVPAVCLLKKKDSCLEVLSAELAQLIDCMLQASAVIVL